MVTFDSTDLDNAASESGTAHESTANTDHDSASVLKQGYDIQNPYLSADLVGYWPLQEDSGTTAYDFSGNNNDGTTNGGVTVNQTGLLGTSAYSFDGTDDVVDLSSFSDYSGYTASIWLYPRDTSTHQGTFSEGTPNYFRIGIKNTGDLWFQMRNSSGSLVEVTGGVTANKWTMATLVWDGATMEGFKDGGSIGTASISSENDVSSGQTVIGENGNADYPQSFDGRVADVRFYNRALSASEVQTLYDVVNTAGTLQTQSKTV